MISNTYTSIQHWSKLAVNFSLLSFLLCSVSCSDQDGSSSLIEPSKFEYKITSGYVAEWARESTAVVYDFSKPKVMLSISRQLASTSCKGEHTLDTEEDEELRSLALGLSTETTKHGASCDGGERALTVTYPNGKKLTSILEADCRKEWEKLVGSNAEALSKKLKELADKYSCEPKTKILRPNHTSKIIHSMISAPLLETSTAQTMTLNIKNKTASIKIVRNEDTCAETVDVTEAITSGYYDVTDANLLTYDVVTNKDTLMDCSTSKFTITDDDIDYAFPTSNFDCYSEYFKTVKSMDEYVTFFNETLAPLFTKCTALKIEL